MCSKEPLRGTLTPAQHDYKLICKDLPGGTLPKHWKATGEGLLNCSVRLSLPVLRTANSGGGAPHGQGRFTRTASPALSFRDQGSAGQCAAATGDQSPHAWVSARHAATFQ